MEVELSFGQVEAALAKLNDIASDKRTAFQARIKNMLRLGFLDVSPGRGRPGRYTAGDVCSLAIALEMAQLGLNPAHAVEVLDDNWARTTTAIAMVCRELDGRPDPLQMFLVFDPAGLASLMEDGRGEASDRTNDTFKYAGLGIVREQLENWTCGRAPRHALINLTALISNVAGVIAPDEGRCETFIRELLDWSEAKQDQEQDFRIAESEARNLEDASSGRAGGEQDGDDQKA